MMDQAEYRADARSARIRVMPHVLLANTSKFLYFYRLYLYRYSSYKGELSTKVIETTNI
jgi:hypothetical protein